DLAAVGESAQREQNDATTLVVRRSRHGERQRATATDDPERRAGGELRLYRESRRAHQAHSLSRARGWQSGRSRAARTEETVCATAASPPSSASTASTRRASSPSPKNSNR